MKEKKHICFISAGLGGGGMERSLTNIANYVAESGHRVTILNLFKTEVFFDLHPAIQIIWPSINREKHHRLIYAMKLIPFIRKKLNEIKPDTVLSFGEWFNGYVLLATRFSGIPVFVTDRMGPQLDLGILLESTRKILYKYADGIIVQTTIAAEILKKKTGVSKIVVIPNPVNCINTDSSIKKQQIVTVGRLSREKGHDVLIKAFAGILNNNWTLHIIGDGKERKSLEILADHLAVKQRVFFYGHLKYFNQILGESDIFVLPSYYEGFPNALIEAMSVPLACISSDCIAGPRDIIKNRYNGLLFEPGNEIILAEILNELIEDNNLRKKLAKNAYNIRKELDNCTITKKYLDFILLNQA